MIVSHHVGMRTRPGSFAGDISPAGDHSSSELFRHSVSYSQGFDDQSSKSLHYQKKKKGAKKTALTKVGSSISKTISSPLSQ